MINDDSQHEEITVTMRKAREILGYSQSKMSSIVNRAKTQIYKREKGLQKPSGAYLTFCRLIRRMSDEVDSAELIGALTASLESVPEDFRNETNALLVATRVCMKHRKYSLADQILGLDAKDSGDDEMPDATNPSIATAVTFQSDLLGEIRQHKNRDDMPDAVRARYEQALLLGAQFVEALRNAIDHEKM